MAKDKSKETPTTTPAKPEVKESITSAIDFAYSMRKHLRTEKIPEAVVSRPRGTLEITADTAKGYTPGIRLQPYNFGGGNTKPQTTIQFWMDSQKPSKDQKPLISMFQKFRAHARQVAKDAGLTINEVSDMEWIVTK